MKKAILILAVIALAACSKKDPTGTTNTNTTVNNDTTIVTKAKWVKYKSLTQYKADGVTEQYRYVNDYDVEGRLMGFTSYWDGIISAKQRDFQYNGNECTYYQETYTNGVLTSTTKIKAEYYND